MPLSRKLLAALTLLLAAGCEDLTSPPAQPTPGAPMLQVNPDEVPQRQNRWMNITSPELWAYITQHDTTITLGVKAPGSVRGIYRSRRLVPDAVWRQAVESLTTAHGGRVLQVDGVLPALRLRVTSLEQLEQLRRLPFVDYVEPAVLNAPRQAPAPSFSLTADPIVMSSSSGAPNHGAYFLNGDSVPVIFPAMQIDAAWARSTGAGVAVGLIDTGVDPHQPQLNRFIKRTVRADDELRDRHGHGTHQAGVLAAPRDGLNVVGVAYGATAISVKHSNDYLDVLTWQVAAALDTAVTYNAKVITMAFRSEDQSNAVSDRISLYYWGTQYDVLFTAAVGSAGWMGQIVEGAIFPSTHPDVIAVSAIDHQTDTRYSGSHYSNKVELSAYHGQPTTGAPLLGEGEWSTSGNSSNAATIVAGVATLVRSRYPHLYNYQVRQLLASTAHDIGPAGRDKDSGYGVVNAMRAVGGLWGGAISRQLVSGGEFGTAGTYELTVHTYGGDGPFNFVWSTGATGPTTQITVGAGETSHVSVRMHDTSDGTIRTTSTDVDGPAGGCENPGEIICS